MEKNFPYSYCPYCGASHSSKLNFFIEHEDGGHLCMSCNGIVYQNPIPVSVMIVPCGVMGSQVFAVRRGIEPFKDQLALPGGFVMEGESWQEAGMREVREELNVVIRGKGVEYPQHILTESTPDGERVLIFGAVSAFHIGQFEQNVEALERVEYGRDHEEELCFPIHRKALELYWKHVDEQKNEVAVLLAK